ncbi:unnamed protein product [Caenorhabditis bovis]|uniref:Protein kinase domain-containing protein n=1 Tax=Caenorhabditis bovis TaxID=2654633 RepID=A0A8S1F6F6_9PELO|nr:unnamed protein product [Caenorhabditis bovis]
MNNQPYPNLQQQQQQSQPPKQPRPSAHYLGASSSTMPPSFPTPPANDADFASTQKATSDLISYMDSFSYPYIKDVKDCYEKLNKIGQGTFGEVFKARCKSTGRMVALKKILMENEKEGFPITALREVKMLQQLKHANITDLIEVCSSKSAPNSRERSTFYLVFAFCDHDLAGLLSNTKLRLSMVHIKTMMKHLLNGLCKLHRSKVLHRDMKAANVLVSKEGVLKLADFGLARPNNQPRQLYTNRVVTLWYRPPELLLGDRQYCTKIDVWGAGCIMAEMWTRKPIMQGDTEQRQLLLISGLCGSINKEVWPACETMPLWKQMATNDKNTCLPQDKPRMLRQKMYSLVKIQFIFRRAQYQYFQDDYAMKLLESLLAIDPDKRPLSDVAVDDVWFYMKPEAKENVKDLMESIPNSHFEYTVGRGAHTNRARHQPRPAQQPQRQNIPAGQYRDLIF